MLTFLVFLLVLSILVLIHEAGHYLTARLFGVKAEEFGYGIPPRIVGWVKVGKKWKRVGRADRKTYENTIWSLNWLPIGGFVRIKGEQGDGEFDADSFHMRPIWQRIVILASGVGMNWLLAAALLSFGLAIGVPAALEELPPGATVERREISIVETLKDSPAAKAGVQAGDVVLRIGPDGARSVQQVRDAIASQDLRSFTLFVRRGDRELAFAVTPIFLEQAKRTGIGVGLAETGLVRYPPLLALQNGVLLAWSYTKAVALSFLDLLKDLVQGGGETVSQVSGPVGIAVITGRIARQGIMPLVHFAALLSINLAVLNFLPIPALDGGRALFLAVEAIRRKAVRRRTEALIHNVSFILLLILISLVTLRDFGRYGGAIVGGLKGLVGM